MDFHQAIVEELKNLTKLSLEEISLLLSPPPEKRLGDYAFPCFKLGKKPAEEAEKLKQSLTIKNLKYLRKIETAGPYLNFYLNPSVLAEETLKEIYQQQRFYGKQDFGKGKKVVIEFSSPNIAKPFGIGHLRSTVIGDSLYKIHLFLGYQPIAINHLGDWGTQFGKLIVAYQKWGDQKELTKDPIRYLLKLYVRFHEEAEKDPSYDDLARAAFKRLEDGDKDSLALWESFKELSLQEFHRIYDLLDIKFDSLQGEASYNNLMESTIADLKKILKSKVEESDGALIVNLEKYQMPPLLLKKSDGASTYHTRDLAAAFYRLKKYHPEKIIYVVGSEQKLHFQQLFQVLQMSGIDQSKLLHVDFGLFRFPEGKMSTRKGNVIFLEEVLNKSIALVEQIIEQKNPGLPNKKEVAKEIGIGAIIFADLSNDRIRNIDFDWDRMLSFEGETGPYVQYTHARACSLLRKAHSNNLNITPNISFDILSLDSEQELVKLLYQFPDILHRVQRECKPHHLAHYLISLSQSFNEFYHHCPVISEEVRIAKARILLVDCTRQVLENGLHLLGLRAPKEM
jgi:arginyl-tRNA synthetase